MTFVLKKAIISYNKELMNNTIKLMNTLLTTNQENNINTVTNQENNINTVTNKENSINKGINKENSINTETTYFKTPEWIKVNTCTINAENNKKLGNKSFKYAIAASKTSGKNRSRLTNIEKFINDFVFKDIDYPLEKNDYETFESNNPSIKLTIFNHYIYVTKLSSLTRYIKHD